MSICFKTPWHQASFDHFLHDSLPQLLTERLPLTGYQVTAQGAQTCTIQITIQSSTDDVQINYANIPYPSKEGILVIDGQKHVVLPLAASERFDEILCVGEQLYAEIKTRLGQAPVGLPWDEAMVRAWLPLDTWINEFMQKAGNLGQTNWLAKYTHLRSIWVAERESAFAPSEFGRVCPFETPEGPNIGRILRIAQGAEIRDGKLIVVDERPEAGLGLSASMIPLLEHNDPNRLLMGANMMRQWIPQSTAEPALVQTGNEPNKAEVWTGRNLLTAFVSWGVDTFDDGIVVSESCARRFDIPYALEPGDKLSNRSGTKGVVSRILPDDEMPHLPDGTAVDLIYDFFGLNARMNIGQVQEAAWSTVAKAEGTPVIAPPFHAPSTDDLKQRLGKAGLSESGMYTLKAGKHGPALEQTSTVGWVYWGRLFHLAQSKLKVATEKSMQRHGEMECYALRDIGAFESLREVLNTKAGNRPGSEHLAKQLAAGPVMQASAPTPMFVDLVQRLNVAGIRLELIDDQLETRFEKPQGEVITLACPVAHPWLHERELTEIGVPVHGHKDNLQAHEVSFSPRFYKGSWSQSMPEYDALTKANERLCKMLESNTPQKLVNKATAQLEARVEAFFDILLQPEHLRFGERQLFSARTVIAPGGELELDQVALADEIAWTLFGPLVVRELGDAQAVETRNAQATTKLDEIMARSWVIVNRAPTLSPTALIAFHPVRDPGHVIRLHPLVCDWFNADFDGDQAAVFLPITQTGQDEAGSKLSVVAHLERDPALITSLLPRLSALWGLARLSLMPNGRQEIARLAGIDIEAPKGMITQETLRTAMCALLERDGVNTALEALERLNRCGFQVAQRSGASMSPFLGMSLAPGATPESDDPQKWMVWATEWAEHILSSTCFDDDTLGPQLLAVNIRTRGRESLPMLVGPRGPVRDIHGEWCIIRHSLVDGLTAEEMFAWVVGARLGLTRLARQWDNIGHETRTRYVDPRRFTMLARARRAKQPGVVFARAAAIGEMDPLTDVDGRLFVGLPVEK